MRVQENAEDASTPQGSGFPATKGRARRLGSYALSRRAWTLPRACGRTVEKPRKWRVPVATQSKGLLTQKFLTLVAAAT
jgi:hypothetical protein